MGKKRIHELAKELSMQSAELIDKLKEWNLVGENITASNSLEDFIADEVRRRLGVAEPSSAPPQVVRRRKKPAAGEVEATEDMAQEITKKTGGTESTLAANEASTEQGAAPLVQEPVRIKPKNVERATIIAPPKAQDEAHKVQSTVLNQVKPVRTPDFLNVIPSNSVAPTPAPAPTPTPESSQGTKTPPAVSEVPAETVVSDKKETAPVEQEVKSQPIKATLPNDVKAKIIQPEPRPESRKVTHELNEPAKIIKQGTGRFESAKVVGSKPNWKDAAGGNQAPGGRPPYQGQGQNRDGGAPRREFNRDGGAAKDNDFQNRRPAGERTPNAGAPRPSRPAVPAQADFPALDAENVRRRDKDKKKKTTGHGPNEVEDGSSKSTRRREIFERSDIYADGAWERVRNRKSKNAKKQQPKQELTQPKAIKRRIKVDEAITVSELAQRLSLKAGDIIKKLMSMGVLASLNQALDFDTATLVAAEFDYEVEKASFDEVDVLASPIITDAQLVTRPPVVTIMGHVDHGKTSLLDYIRKTNIQKGEAGGITQHIGAYHVSTAGRHITFLDTPGHEAFTSMRSRGAQVTDIVILIVAADDGLMPQTREAADHARAAKVPIIVAINKIDKPSADPERIRRQMMEIGLVSEEWGGDTVFVEISAKSGQGIDELLDMIILQADILELKARSDGYARGHIVEARLDKGRGPVATVLVQEGMLKQGDPYVCGVFYGKIRALLNDQGERVPQAGPAIPVEIQGISGVPQAGDEFIALADEKQARQVSQHRLIKQRASELIQTSKLTLENLFDKVKAGAVRGLNLIVKTDVQGSLEAIVDAVMKLSSPEIKINIIHQSTGSVSETDVMLASASSALILCFGVRPSTKVSETADIEQVQIRYYDVIYQLLDDIKEAMAGLLDPIKSEKVLGRAEVRATFVVNKVGTIAGSYVLDGKIIRGAKARLLRDGVVIHDGRLSSLKRVKDDAKEVTHGYECGIGFENYNDLKIGDHIEAYLIEETAAGVHLVDEAAARARAKEEADLKAENQKAEEEVQE